MSVSTVPRPDSAGRGPIGVPGGTDRSYQVDVIVCAVITSVIGTAFVAMRFYTRGIMLKCLGWEDWLILIAQIFSIAVGICFSLEAAWGWDQHMWLIDPASLVPINKVFWCTVLFYELSLWFSEVSIILLYMRIWTFPWVRKVNYVLLGVIMIYNTYVTISVFLACIPLAAWWDPTIKNAYCHPKTVWWVNTYMHIAVDFFVFCVPIPVIWTLHFPRKQKLVLLFIFTFGFFICCISIVRAVLLELTANSPDPSYDNVSTGFWTCLETNVTVVIACLMTLKPLLSRFFPRFLSSHSGSGRAGSDAAANDGSNGRRVLTIGSRPTRPYHAGLRTEDDDADLETGIPQDFDPAHPRLETIKDEGSFSPTCSSAATTAMGHDPETSSHEKF